MTAWLCPFCHHAQTITTPKYSVSRGKLDVKDNSISDSLGYEILAIGCSNPECKKVTVSLSLGTYNSEFRNGSLHTSLKDSFLYKRIVPESDAKHQPEYIPKAVRDDYVEACRIRDLSPKASATLSRRCLQGMIRDFCGISKNRLIDEIDALRRAVQEGTAAQGVSLDSIDAIDGLRKIGNIGAHMEKDIDVIVDVDPNEAQALIELIESLFDEWYVARDKRQRRFAKVAEVATQKSEAKNPLSKKEPASKP